MDRHESGRVESAAREDATVHRLVPKLQVPADLPAQLTSFVGRQREVAELAGLLEQCRLVTVTGPGGVGKSRAALESLSMLAERGQRTLWVALGPLTRGGQAAVAVAAALGLRKQPGRPLAETIAEQLCSERLLLCVDNAEHLIDEVATLVSTLLLASPGLTVLTTSREPLQIAGETIWRLSPLSSDDAVALFTARAALVRPAAAAPEPAVVRALCDRLDRLPLAIELAAARLGTMTVTEVAASLDDRFRLLTGNLRGVLPQQRTLEASIAWSHDLLEPAGRRLLRRLSVFAGDFGAQVADVVGEEPGVLAHLVDRSLVQVVESDPRRFQLLESVRDFARARLVEAGEGEQVRSRHAQAYLDLAEQAAPQLIGVDAPRWLARLDAEAHELEAGLEWAAGLGDLEHFRRMVVALGLFWELRRPADGVRWLRHAVHAEGDSSVLWAQVLWQSAHMGVYGDDVATTQRRAPEALAAAEQCGDARTLARAVTTATYCHAVHDPAAARKALATSVEQSRDLGDRWGTADALKMTSIACLTMGDDDGLLRVIAELRTDADAMGNAFFLAWCDAVEGYIAVQRGETKLAQARLSASADRCREVGDPLTGWLTTAWLGDLAVICGERQRARQLYEETLARAGASGGTLSQVWALVGTARLLREDGDPQAAFRLLVPRAEWFRVADPLWRALFCTALGRALVASSSDVGDGEEWLLIGRDAAEEIGNPRLTADALQALGELAVVRDQPSIAEAAHRRALSLRSAAGYVPALLDSLEDLALLPGFPGRERESQRLLAATASLRSDRGLPRARPVPQEHSDGAGMTLEEAVSYATRSRGTRGRPGHGWASLTPTELDVVRLVAEGLSNPEVGERMFIGRGTVKTHLSHVYAKLGLSTRAAVAAEFTRRQGSSLPLG